MRTPNILYPCRTRRKRKFNINYSQTKNRSAEEGHTIKTSVTIIITLSCVAYAAVLFYLNFFIVETINDQVYLLVGVAATIALITPIGIYATRTQETHHNYTVEQPRIKPKYPIPPKKGSVDPNLLLLKKLEKLEENQSTLALALKLQPEGGKK